MSSTVFTPIWHWYRTIYSWTSNCRAPWAPAENQGITPAPLHNANHEKDPLAEDLWRDTSNSLTNCFLMVCKRDILFFSHHYSVDIMWGNKLKYDWSGKWLYIVTVYKLVKHCNYAPESGMKCLPRETASEMRTTYMSMHDTQWVFMPVFNYYILQLRSQRAPSAFDKAWYFTLACVSVKWERVRVIDRGSVEMMHFPCDCFHSHYSQHRVISRPAADTSAWACASSSHRRVRLPLP